MRISGITIPDNKRLEVGLMAVHGIGRSNARKILANAKISVDTRAKELNPEKEGRIRKLIEGYVIEGDLKRAKSSNIKRIKDIKTYRGIRHSKNLPVRGQRTRTNARTVHGNVRNTMGSGKRSIEKK